MLNKRIEVTKNLYNIAVAQQGYFTASQACTVGIGDNTHPYHVRVGNWIREWRGIYRLSQFPESEDSYMVLWSLWSRNKTGIIQGVYSHETALSIYELSDINPEKLHMTVPQSFRRSIEIPISLVIHRGNIKDSECLEKLGYRLTNPYRTIIDILDEGKISLEHIQKAIMQSLKRGILTRSEYKALRKNPNHGELIRKLMKEN